MAGEGANVIRSLLVSLGIKVDRSSLGNLKNFQRAVEETKTQLGVLAEAGVKVGKYLAAGFGAAIGAGSALVLTTAASAQNIERQAKALGLTRKEYQEYAGVFAKFGADSKEISEAFLQITEKVFGLGQGQQETVKQFKAIGLSFSELKGKRPGEVFEIVATAIAKTTDRQAALGVASQLFGEDTAKKLLPALTQGGAAIRKMREEIDELGGVMTDQQLYALIPVAKQWQEMKVRLTGVRNTIAAALAPTMERLITNLNRWLKANREILAQRVEGWANALERALKGLDRAVQLIGGWDTVLLGVATGAGMLLLLANLEKIEELLKAARVAMIALDFVGAATIGAPLTPLLLVLGGLLLLVGLVALAVDDFVVSMEGGRSVIGGWLDTIESVFPAFGSFRDLMSATRELVVALVGEFERFGTALLTGVKPAIVAVQIIVDALGNSLGGLWDKLQKFLSLGNEWATGKIMELTNTINAGDASGFASLQGKLAADTAGAVNRAFNSPAGSTDNSVRTATTNATFHGATQSEISGALESTHRKAGMAVRGGKR